MSNETIERSAAPCGAMAAVLLVKLDDINFASDGSVTMKGGTKGDTKGMFPVEVSANETAAEQVKVFADRAKAQGVPGIKIWVHGPAEVDFSRSKQGDERVLKLCIGADLIRGAHADEKIEPLQNAGVLFGTPDVEKKTSKEGQPYYMGKLTFTHLASGLVEGDIAPAEVKLSGASAEKLLDNNGENVIVSGRFSRQTGTSNGNAFDHISFAVNNAASITIPNSAGRKAPQSNTSNTLQMGYENDVDDVAKSNESLKAAFDSMDDF